MNKLRCLIVDDEPIARSIVSSYIARVQGLVEVAQCRSGVETLAYLADHEVDIIFLDIQMPDITGLTLAKTISTDAQVIFTTAYRDYAVDGFDLQATDYLLKPIAFDRFLQAVDRVRDRTALSADQPSEELDHIFVRADRRMIRVPFDELRYIESLGDYIQIYLGDRRVTVRDTIAHMEELLPADRFMRVHRSYMVGLERIDSYSAEQIDIGDVTIPVSRSYRAPFLDRMGE